MPLRVICFILSLCLFWAGIGSFESPALPAETGSVEQAFAHVDGDGQRTPGTVTDHHLDDQPSQPHSDTQAAGLPPPPLLKPGTPAKLKPSAGPQPCMLTPYIEGPQRPPRCTAPRSA
jgi:hypothetical protein